MKYKLICLLLVVFCCSCISAQNIFDSTLNTFSTKYPQEKIYLQFDKSYYTSNETIWFKAYITSNNLPTFVSKTFYAELLNADGKILQTKIAPILQGGAASFFDLADSNYNAKLYIRSYTSWMMNFDSSLFYVKPLNVFNTKTNTKKNITTPSYTLTLFPEGGDLIENVNNRIAFKTNNQDGIPFAVSGNIVDSKNKIIIPFSSTHDGMGVFSITSLPNEKYKAVWKDKNNISHETQLPTAKQQGVSLSVSNANKHLFYSLTRPDIVDDNFKAFTVVAQINQQLVYIAKINLKTKTTVTAPILTDSVPDGLMQITIFDAAQKPVAERLAFINNNSYYFNTDLHLIEKNITRRGRNVLQLDIGDNYLTNLSVAVTDANLDAAENNKENIFSGLLISSDLKGYIYNPAQYFASEEDSVQQQLDMVMMTNGWRRYQWQNLLNGRWPTINHLPDNYLSIKGNVFGLSKMQLNNRSLTAIVKTSGANGNSILSIPVLDDGKFNVNGMYFFDTAKIAYQFNNDKDKLLTSKASFTFNNGLEKSPTINLNTFLNVLSNQKPDSSILQKSFKQSALFRSQEDMQKSKTLQTIIVTSKEKTLKEKLNEEYTSGLFNNGDARIFTTEDDPSALSAISILDYLRGKVAGLQISTDGDGSITRRGSKTDVFLNESHTEISLLQSTPMSDVAMIKVFDPPFFGASGGGAGGAVAVYTKKGASANANIKGLNTAMIFGYSSIKQFYMPNYDKPDAPDAADFRTTLYWNPFVLMDAKKKRLTIPIFNNDNCKKIRVIIEGINELGLLTREEKVFE